MSVPLCCVHSRPSFLSTLSKWASSITPGHTSPRSHLGASHCEEAPARQACCKQAGPVALVCQEAHGHQRNGVQHLHQKGKDVAGAYNSTQWQGDRETQRSQQLQHQPVLPADGARMTPAVQMPAGGQAVKHGTLQAAGLTV